MTAVYVFVAEHPDHGTEVVQVYGHIPSDAEQAGALASHVRDSFDEELSDAELAAEIAAYERAIVHGPFAVK